MYLYFSFYLFTQFQKHAVSNDLFDLQTLASKENIQINHISPRSPHLYSSISGMARNARMPLSKRNIYDDTKRKLWPIETLLNNYITKRSNIGGKIDEAKVNNKNGTKIITNIARDASVNNNDGVKAIIKENDAENSASINKQNIKADHSVRISRDIKYKITSENKFEGKSNDKVRITPDYDVGDDNSDYLTRVSRDYEVKDDKQNDTKTEEGTTSKDDKVVDDAGNKITTEKPSVPDQSPEKIQVTDSGDITESSPGTDQVTESSPDIGTDIGQVVDKDPDNGNGEIEDQVTRDTNAIYETTSEISTEPPKKIMNENMSTRNLMMLQKLFLESGDYVLASLIRQLKISLGAWGVSQKLAARVEELIRDENDDSLKEAAFDEFGRRLRAELYSPSMKNTIERLLINLAREIKF